MRLKSYDLFDTLVTRLTRRPVDVFRLLGASGKVEFRFHLAGIVPFHVWRRRAERLARFRSSREDIRLVDIYRLLGKIIRHPARVMRLEMALENALITSLPETVAELAAHRRDGMPCCVISDMYLPRRFLQKLVRQHMKENIPVFVSSESGMTKESGNLFRHVARVYDLPLSEIHHSGDNPVADVAVPSRLGMGVTPLPAPAGENPAGLLDVLKCPSDDPFFEMGFRVSGPTALVMAVCLAEQAEREKPANLIFGARDMFLVYEAFRRLTNDSFPAHYCRVSRSAVFRAQFYVSGNTERLFETIAETGEVFFSCLGADCPPELATLSPRHHRRRFQAALQAEGFMRESKREFEVVRDYLLHEGFRTGTWFVDLGWRGTVQQAIDEILRPDHPISGKYLGTLTPHPLRQGFYFDGGRPWKRWFRVMQALSFIELVFMEAAPSLRRVTRDDTGFRLIHASDDAVQQADRARIALGARAFLDTMIPLCQMNHFSTSALLRALDDLYDRYLLAPPDHWVEALGTSTYSRGLGETGTQLLLGDDTGTPLGLLRSEWQGGYLRKHAHSRWLPVLRVLHDPLPCLAWNAFKKHTRPIRNWLRL
jgi:FMN phosphatase YigB (HAD superfamily)